MNWVKLFLILYAIYFAIIAIVITALYFRFILIDIDNEEAGIYEHDEERRSDHTNSTILVLFFLLLSGTAPAQNSYGYKITITDAATHHTKLVHTVSCAVVDSIVTTYFAPAITTFNSFAYFSATTARHFDFTANNTYLYCEKMRIKTTKKGKLKFLKEK